MSIHTTFNISLNDKIKKLYSIPAIQSSKNRNDVNFTR